MTDRAPVVTRVAVAPDGDNRFRGYSVKDDLAGRASYWAAASLAMGGPLLGEQASRTLDDLTICTLSCDPRIWPFKVVQLAGCEGHAQTALASGILAHSSPSIGHGAAGVIARTLVPIAERVGDPPDPDGLRAVFAEHRERGERLPGFGVPFRRVDERVVAFEACLERRGMQGTGRFWRLIKALEAVVVEAGGPPMNAACLVAVVGLDLGFPAERMHMFAVLTTWLNVFANAVEGAERAGGELRAIPAERVRCTADRRRSPRAVSAEETE